MGGIMEKRMQSHNGNLAHQLHAAACCSARPCRKPAGSKTLVLTCFSFRVSYVRDKRGKGLGLQAA